MEIVKVAVIKEEPTKPCTLVAWWSYLGQEHVSDSIELLEENGKIKIKLDSKDGTFMYDENTFCSDNNFKIEFYSK